MHLRPHVAEAAQQLCNLRHIRILALQVTETDVVSGKGNVLASGTGSIRGNPAVGLGESIVCQGYPRGRQLLHLFSGLSNTSREKESDWLIQIT